mgnify:CR=1 FL=1
MLNNQTLYYGEITIDEWRICLAVTEKGLCFVGNMAELRKWVRRKFPQGQLVKSIQKISAYEEQFKEYFSGQRTTFTFPLDVIGTSFQQKVWRKLREIPHGETVSYQDIAEKIGNPRSVRAVGAAVGANPLLIVIPCHRVVRKNGELGGFRAGLALKKKLLLLERASVMKRYTVH